MAPPLQLPIGATASTPIGATGGQLGAVRGVFRFVQRKPPQTGPSPQVPYQALTVYHRQLTAAKSFITEVFSGISAPPNRQNS